MTNDDAVLLTKEAEVIERVLLEKMDTFHHDPRALAAYIAAALLRTRSPAGGQWRPVSEVPTDSVGPDFLALYHDGFICTESPVRTAEDWRDSGVTHWMPIPSPPDDERKE